LKIGEPLWHERRGGEPMGVSFVREKLSERIKHARKRGGGRLPHRKDGGGSSAETRYT